jgi:hypothetical protein
MGEVLTMAQNDSVSSPLVAHTRIGTLGDMGELNAAEHAFTGRGSNRLTDARATAPTLPVQAIPQAPPAQPPAAVVDPAVAPGIGPAAHVAPDPIQAPDLFEAPELPVEVAPVAPVEAPVLRTRPIRSNRGVSHQYSGYAQAAQEVETIYAVLESGWEEVTPKCFDPAHNIFVLGEVDDMTYIEYIIHVDNPGDEYACAMSYNEAITNNPDPDERKAFQEAAHQEFYGNLIGKGCVKFVTEDELPADAEPLSLLWTMLWKIDSVTGKKVRAKARCCQRGDLAKPFVHYDPAVQYSPTPSMTAAKMVITMGLKPGIFLLKFDVTAAFTKASPGRRTWLFTPQGMHQYDDLGRKMLLEQMSNLYGSVDAARRWLDLAFEQIIAMGFRRSLWDPCLMRMTMPKAEVAEYIQREILIESDQEFKREETALSADDTANEFGIMHEGARDIPEVAKFDFDQLIGNQPFNDDPETSWVTGVLWVDDGLYASNDRNLLENVKDKMLLKFPGTFEWNPTSFLGMAVQRPSAGKMIIAQHVLAEKMVATAKLTDCKPHPIPLTAMVDVSERPVTQSDKNQAKSKMNNVQEVVGQLGYLIHTRPELKTAYGQMSRIASNPAMKHLKALKRVIRYVQGTLDHGIEFTREGPQDLVVFVDTNFDATVYTGIVAYYNGGPIEARTMRQKTVKISSFTAEGVGLCECVRLVVYLRALIRDTGERIDKPTTIYCDNQAAIAVANRTDGHTNKARHYKIRMKWVQERIAAGDVIIKYVKSAMNVADLLTKPLALPTWRILAPQVRGADPIVALNEAVNGTQQSLEEDLADPN